MIEASILNLTEREREILNVALLYFWHKLGYDAPFLMVDSYEEEMEIIRSKLNMGDNAPQISPEETYALRDKILHLTLGKYPTAGGVQ